MHIKSTNHFFSKKIENQDSTNIRILKKNMSGFEPNLSNMFLDVNGARKHIRTSPTFTSTKSRSTPRSWLPPSLASRTPTWTTSCRSDRATWRSSTVSHLYLARYHWQHLLSGVRVLAAFLPGTRKPKAIFFLAHVLAANFYLVQDTGSDFLPGIRVLAAILS